MFPTARSEGRPKRSVGHCKGPLLLTEKFSARTGPYVESARALSPWTIRTQGRGHESTGTTDALFHHGVRPKGRIVSLDRPYVRPIVSGKHKSSWSSAPRCTSSNWTPSALSTTFPSTPSTRVYGSERLSSISRDSPGPSSTSPGPSHLRHHNNSTFTTGNGISTDFKRKGRAGKHRSKGKNWPPPSLRKGHPPGGQLRKRQGTHGLEE